MASEALSFSEQAALDEFLTALRRGEFETAEQALFADPSIEVRSVVLLRANQAFLSRTDIRARLLPLLGRSIRELADAEAYEPLLKSLIEAVRTELAMGALQDVPGQLDAIESLGRHLGDGFRVYFGRLLRAELWFAQGDAQRAKTQLDTHLRALVESEGISDLKALLRYGNTLKMLLSASTGDLNSLEQAVDGIQRIVRTPTALWTYHRALLDQGHGRAEAAKAGMQAVVRMANGPADQGWAFEALLALGRAEPLGDHLQRARTLIAEWGDPVAARRLQVAEARAALAAGQPAAAFEALENLPPDDLDLDGMMVLAEVYLTSAAPEAHARAATILQRLLALSESRGATGTLALAHQMAARVRDDHGTRSVHLERARAAYEQLGDRAGMARVDIDLAGLALDSDRPHHAVSLAIRAQDTGRTLGRPELLVAGLFLQARAARQMDRREESTAALEKALRAATDAGLVTEQRQCLIALGRPDEATRLAAMVGRPVPTESN